MAFVPFPDGAELQMIYDVNGKTVSFGTWFRYVAGSPADVHCIALADSANSSFAPLVQAEQSNDTELTDIVVSDRSAANAPQYGPTLFTPRTGTVGADSVDNKVCMTVTLRTNLKGRSFRGRVYIPGYPENSLIDSLWGTATAAVAAGYMGSLRGFAAAIGWEMVVASKFTGGAPRAAVLPTAITSQVGRVATTSQRRRRRLV